MAAVGTGRKESRPKIIRRTICASARVSRGWAEKCTTFRRTTSRSCITCSSNSSAERKALVMEKSRFESIASGYGRLRIAVVGDFCLDRYLEIDPTRQEVSIETGLPVYNVVDVRAQPGGAGTILNNLVALGISTIYPVGFRGVDGEGFELHNALA